MCREAVVSATLLHQVLVDYRVLVDGPHLTRPDTVRLAAGVSHTESAFTERRST